MTATVSSRDFALRLMKKLVEQGILLAVMGEWIMKTQKKIETSEDYGRGPGRRRGDCLLFSAP